MEKAFEFLQSVTPEGFSAPKYLIFLLVVIVGSLVVGGLGRLIFGEKAVLQRSVSCAIAILFIYVINVIVYSTGAKLDFILSPLPFVGIEGDYLTLFNVLGSGFKDICTHVLNMVILAFLMNLIDSIMPRGQKLLSWYFFRFLSVIMAICLHFLVNLLLGLFVPIDIAQYAPIILLIVLIAALLLGALKLVVGGLLAFLDPILGILYTFFFSTIVGTQLSKAILTTVLLTALVCLLNYLQIGSVYISSSALIAYLPVLVIVLVLWYIIGNLFVKKKK